MRADAPGLYFAFRAAGEGGLGDGGDAWQRFAAKAEGGDVLKVVKVADFAGGVGGEGEREVVRVDAAAVVAHADEFAAAVFDVDVDVCRPGVDGVFHDFFDDGGGALDDFTGGDLVDEVVGQLLDAGHGDDGAGIRALLLPFAGELQSRRGWGDSQPGGLALSSAHPPQRNTA